MNEIYVRIRKLSAVVNPDYPSAQRETYKCGTIPDEDVSVFVDYEVEGHISQMPEVDSSICMFRRKRNGVDYPGIFRTSPITKVFEGGFHTRNSVYEIEVL